MVRRQRHQERESKNFNDEDTEDDSDNKEQSKRARRDHPYGIKPLGNFLLDSLSPNFRGEARTPGLGAFARLNDELLLTFLGDYLTAQDICNLTQASKAFYLLGRHEELWRGLVINNFGPRGTFRFYRTWCETFARSTLLSQAGISEEDAVTFSNLDTHRATNGMATELLVPQFLESPHIPLAVPNYYSDYLYQSHVCATQPLCSYSETEENIDRRENLSVERFIAEYEKPGKPVIITDIVTQWPAYKKWTRESLTSRYGDRKFTAEAVDLRLTDYLAYADAQNDESPLYLFDKRFGETCPDLADEYMVPDYFREDLFHCLGDKRPDYRWLIIGPARSGSTFHKDPNHTSAWNAVITGAKKWVMFPPHTLPPGVFISEDESERNQKSVTKPMEGICRAGEMIFVPAGWWHAVINLDFSIAVTQNYVSQQNLVSVLSFLRDKPDQISGIRCSTSLEDTDVGDGRQCEEEKLSFYKRFADALAKLKPDIWTRACATLNEKDQIQRLLEEERNKPSAWEMIKENATRGGFSFSFCGPNVDEEL